MAHLCRGGHFSYFNRCTARMAHRASSLLGHQQAAHRTVLLLRA